MTQKLIVLFLNILMKYTEKIQNIVEMLFIETIIILHFIIG